MNFVVLFAAVLNLVALTRGERCPTSADLGCAADMTCCLTPSGQQGCCLYANATCCQDRVHCCPSGSSCVTGSGGHCRSEQLELENVIPAQLMTQDTTVRLLTQAVPMTNDTNKICIDGSACGDASTCCPVGGGRYGCCSYSQAVCCSDLLHCCPHGSSCRAGGICLKAVSETSTGIKTWPMKPKKLTSTICPGGRQQCPDDNTCCPTAQGDWGCCPYRNANCCSDNRSCCPFGSQCLAGRCYRMKNIFSP